MAFGLKRSADKWSIGGNWIFERDQQSQILAARSAIVALKYDVAEAVQGNASKVITVVAGNDDTIAAKRMPRWC
jgi:hypothetical protein